VRIGAAFDPIPTFSSRARLRTAPSATRLGIMFDLLDPNHPHLVSSGTIDTTKKLPDLIMSIQ